MAHSERLCEASEPPPRVLSPAPWCCEGYLATIKAFLARSPTKWAVDSGANGVIVPLRDKAIKNVLSGSIGLDTTAGPVWAKPCLIDTPFGVREGLACEGAPRLFPAGETEEFRKIKTATIDGVTYDLVWEDGIPMICTDHGTDRTLSAFALVPRGKRNTRRRAKKRERKRAQRRDEEAEAAEVAVADSRHTPPPPSPSTPKFGLKEEPGSPTVEVDECARELDFSSLFTVVPTAFRGLGVKSGSENLFSRIRIVHASIVISRRSSIHRPCEGRRRIERAHQGRS
jgi:hypothetical protein